MSETIYSNNFQLRVALGLVPGWEILRKFGMNDAVAGTSTTQDVWPVGTPRTLPTSAGVVSVSSSSTSDDGDPAGTGAQTIQIDGLNSDYLEISESVTLNGTSAVTTTQSFLRINRAYVTLSGSATWNVGDITMSIGGNTQAFIEATEGQTHQTMYTVPANKVLLIKQYRWTVGRMSGSTDCQVSGQIMLYGSNTWRYISDIYAYGPMSYYNDDGVTYIPPKTEVRAQTISSGATEISAIFAGYLVKTTEFNR